MSPLDREAQRCPSSLLRFANERPFGTVLYYLVLTALTGRI